MRRPLSAPETATVVQLGAVYEGSVPDVALGAEAETAAPAQLIRPLVEIEDIVELAHPPVRLVDSLSVLARDRDRHAAKPVCDGTRRRPG
jgi:hypothetical protein